MNLWIVLAWYTVIFVATWLLLERYGEREA